MARFVSIVLCSLLALWSGTGLAADISGARIWSAPDNTRVVFDINAPVKYKVFTLDKPSRLVLDFQDSKLRGSLKALDQSNNDYFSRVRYAHRNDGRFRLVFDLKRPVRTDTLLLKPNQHYGYRLVLDLEEHAPRRRSAATATRPASVKPVTGGNTGNRSPEAKTQPKATPPLRDVVVAIDAGHGGEDPGAIGRRGTREKDVVLAIARKLQQLVNKAPGMRAEMIRGGDYFVPLNKRRRLARSRKADLFVSIHADAFRASSVRGSSVFVLSERGASSEAARLLAESENATDLIGGVHLDDTDEVLNSVLMDLSRSGTIEASVELGDRVLSHLGRVGKVHKRKVGHANFVVLKSLGIPSILVETGFISNRGEESKLKNRVYQKKLADALLAGIKDYFADHAPPGTHLAAGGVRHIVRRGDTLSEIADRYNTSPRAIRSLNMLNSDMLIIGRVLRIPSS